MRTQEERIPRFIARLRELRIGRVHAALVTATDLYRPPATSRLGCALAESRDTALVGLANTTTENTFAILIVAGCGGSIATATNRARVTTRCTRQKGGRFP